MSKLSASFRRPWADGKSWGLAVKSAVGGNGIPVEQFLSKPVEHWVKK
jgi:hypothetical protein